MSESLDKSAQVGDDFLDSLKHTLPLSEYLVMTNITNISPTPRPSSILTTNVTGGFGPISGNWANIGGYSSVTIGIDSGMEKPKTKSVPQRALKLDYDSLSQKNKARLAIPQFIMDILQPNRVWLAGGALRSVFDGTPVKDYDIYVASKSDREFVVDYFKSLSKNVKTENDITDVVYGKFKIQIIGIDYPSNTEDIFKNFDFHCCMFALDRKTLTVGGKTTLRSVRHKSIYGMNVDSKILNRNIFSIVKRVSRYRDKGYHVSYAVWRDIFLHISEKIKTDDVMKAYMKYHSRFDTDNPDNSDYQKKSD